MHCTHTAHITGRTTHVYTLSALRARQLSIHCVLLSGRNVIPHLYSYSFLIFFYSPLHSHCDSKGRAYLKLTPAPWYPLRIPTRYYSVPGMGSATWRTFRMSGMEMLNSRGGGQETPPSSFTAASGVNSFKATEVFFSSLNSFSFFSSPSSPLFSWLKWVYRVKSAKAQSAHLTSRDQSELWIERTGGQKCL